MNSPARISDLTILYPDGMHFIALSPDGEIAQLTPDEAADQFSHLAVLVCHRQLTEARLGLELPHAFDILELFAFVRPAQFCLPAPEGLARKLGMAIPFDAEDKALSVGRAATLLLQELSATPAAQAEQLASLADMMGKGGWSWSTDILAALGKTPSAAAPPDGRAAHVWTTLNECEDVLPRAMAGAKPVSPSQIGSRLKSVLGEHAETRESQTAYAQSVGGIFAPPDEDKRPHFILAEAGTGTGKTLGYLTPASLWAEENAAGVWISTYTRTLQHQIASELTRFYPDADERQKKVTIRKGRENYLCLLNLEEALQRMPGMPQSAIALGLMARWVSASEDGDLTGAGFPAWLSDIVGRRFTLGLADRRGECIHSACSHYSKCFVEKSIRGARQADIIIANHALVMVQAVMQSYTEQPVPTRYIFDEGHHVFDAADSAFATHLTALETIELRLWIRGAEDGRGGRARGIRRRLEELVADNETALAALEEATEAARILPWTGWTKRLAGGSTIGEAEAFFAEVRKQVYLRNDNPHAYYDIQTELYPAHPDLIAAAHAFKDGLENLLKPLLELAAQLEKMLEEDTETLDSQTRQRLESLSRGLLRRASGPVAAWCQLLGDIASDARPGFIDWMQITRIDSADKDVGIFRHWLDPTQPFAETLLKSAHGVAITSATLTDQTENQTARNDSNGQQAESEAKDTPSPFISAQQLVGAAHLEHEAEWSTHSSPFDYASQARIYVVNDVQRDKPEIGAAAMAGLMKASDGRALALYTSIQRLKATWPFLAEKLSSLNIPLYAQHQDRMNLQTLLQLFREDPRSVLMGTDAVRDGVDVPGEALQLMIYDRVPWPRPDKLFQARAEWLGRNEWTDRLTRLKLRQAFGRLIRRQDDKGVFVILDSRLPTRLTSAFPPDIPIERIGIAQAIEKTRIFLGTAEN